MADPHCPFCDTPLSEHPAGRCLDGWAAQARGMCSCVPFDFICGLSGPVHDCFFDEETQLWRHRPCGGWLHTGDNLLPEYSTNDSAAMLLWREMKEGEVNCALRAETHISVVTIAAYFGEASMLAPTESEAITKAYIAARMAAKEKPDGQENPK